MGRWFSLGPPVSSTNKTERHDITEILLKVALNTIKPTNQPNLQLLDIFNCAKTHFPHDHSILQIITGTNIYLYPVIRDIIL
jgi:hypothetical protein